MHIAILTFQGFNELDSLVALGVLNRIKKPEWRVTLCCPEPTVTSMNGVVVHAQSRLEEAQSADAVIVGSGIKTREIVNDPAIMSALRLDPEAPADRRAVLRHADACEARHARRGARVHRPHDQALGRGGRRRGARINRSSPLATSPPPGGCLASQYLAAWIIARTEGLEAARSALHYVAPVGEKDEYVASAMKNIVPYLAPQ